MKDNGINEMMKLELYAMGANNIMMRIENIADVFDSDGNVIYQEVNVEKLASQLYEIANNGSNHLASIEIEETSITGNQSYQEMEANRFKWKTTDDTDYLKEEQDEGMTKMKFQQ